MPEKSSFMGKKSSFKGKKSSFKLFGKIEFPSKRTKKPEVVADYWGLFDRQSKKQEGHSKQKTRIFKKIECF